MTSPAALSADAEADVAFVYAHLPASVSMDAARERYIACQGDVLRTVMSFLDPPEPIAPATPATPPKEMSRADKARQRIAEVRSLSDEMDGLMQETFFKAPAPPASKGT